MKCSFTLFVLVATVFMMGCTSGSKINGRSVKTANRSVSMIKDRLPTEQRIEFEVSYWTIRDAIRNNKEFLDLVDGKTADEMIVLGKDNFQQRKDSGFKGYEKYTNWDQMIAKLTKERIDQGRQNLGAKDRDNNILYSL
jgi:hypothetical protein